MKNLNLTFALILVSILSFSCSKETKIRKKIGGKYDIIEYKREIMDLNGNILSDTTVQNIGNVNFIDQGKSLYTSNDGLYDLKIFTYAFDQLNSFSNTALKGDFEWGNNESNEKVLLQTYDAATYEYVVLPFTITKLKKKKMSLVYVYFNYQTNGKHQYISEEFELDQTGK